MVSWQVTVNLWRGMPHADATVKSQFVIVRVTVDS